MAAPPDIEVVAGALLHHGRVLSARRVHPPDVAGGWELPGGKARPDETREAAVVRELREELGCSVAVVGAIEGRVDVKPGYVLTVLLVRLVSGEPVPHEHDAVRWLGPEELGDVEWLPADRPFLPTLRELLLDGERLPGGNVAGAVRVGRTVRRATGPWTEAVHALLDHLRAAGLVQAPQVLGYDGRGREVLTFLPGRVPDVDVEVLDESTLADAMRWLRRFHEAVREFRPAAGLTWRTVHRGLATDEIVCHHDFAPYNVALTRSPDGECLAGVFDWDMSGPGTALQDLAFAAWNWVPLWRDLAPALAAERVEVMASAYGAAITAVDIVDAVQPRIRRSLDVIRAGQMAGDPGMLNLRTVGEPERTTRSLANLAQRIPAIRRELQRS
ncbi:MAG TPA: phosphotransferase [Nocardioidaceae bacterium]